VRELARGFGGNVPVGEGVAACAEDGDVGVHADDAVFEFLFKAGHDGEDDDQGSDADGNAENRDEGEEGDKALVAAGAHEVTESSNGFIVHSIEKVPVF